MNENKAVDNSRVTIVCDDCDFNGETNNMMEWLNKPCPKCGAADLITEKDIETYNALNLLIHTCNEVFGEELTNEVDSGLSHISVKVTNGEIKKFEINEIDDNE